MLINSCGIFILREDNKILVGHPTEHAIDAWSIPKGRMEEGETHIDTSIRETLEETNIDLSNYRDKLIPLEPVNYLKQNKILHPFLLIVRDCVGLSLDNIEIKCNSNYHDKNKGVMLPEMDDYKYITLDEAYSLLHETQVNCIDKIKSLLQR